MGLVKNLHGVHVCLAKLKQTPMGHDSESMRWFWHVLRMDEYCMARRVLMAEVSVAHVQGRPRLGWMDGVKVALGNRGMTVEAALQYA